jgi:murein DD-endopeptidase MepM/ murein hydrolase activator NlpD
MEYYKVRKGETLSSIGRKFKISTAAMIKANPQIRNPDVIFVGQRVNVPTSGRHAPTPESSGPTLGDVYKDAVSTDGEPAKDGKYVENAIVAVGIPIWGGPFYLYQQVSNGVGTSAVVLDRNEVFLDSDPLKESSMQLRMVYASRSAANEAVTKAEDSYKVKGLYVYYKDGTGLIYPTILSDQTAPALCKALRQAVEQERSDAKAAAKLGTDLLLWYVGARLPIKAGEAPAQAAAATDATLAGFNAVERGVITEVRGFLTSPEIAKIRAAYATGSEVSVKIGGRLIQYEPSLNASGMTMFGENGFLIGRQAFASEAEFIKTLLHETYRLTTSNIGRTGAASGAEVLGETDAAFRFAERAYDAVLAGIK